MRLTHLRCRSFRCLRDIDFAPGADLNVIRGRNAQGKTSLLEAILFAATSKSHRTTVETELANRDSGEFHIHLTVQREDREVTVEIHWWKGQKRVKINGAAQSRLSDLLGKVRVVLFAPEDIALVKSGSAMRRRFMDMALAQVAPAYLAALQQYRQILRQRNELLRMPRPDPAQLDVWDTQLARDGAVLIRARAEFVRELDELAAGAYARISGGESLRMSYLPDCPPDRLADVLGAKRENDIRRKMTLHGPHRDEIEIAIAGAPARSQASQGQQKSAALAIRLAEMNLVHRRTGERPILLLDEVLAELDAQRARQLFDAIPDSAQCFITTTDLTRVIAPPNRSVAEFVIEQGALSPERAGAGHVEV
jgi:DNA replication and repair protein RecF